MRFSVRDARLWPQRRRLRTRAMREKMLSLFSPIVHPVAWLSGVVAVLCLLLLGAGLARVRLATSPGLFTLSFILGAIIFPAAHFFELWSNAVVAELGFAPRAGLVVRVVLAAGLAELILILTFAQLLRRLEPFRGAADAVTVVLALTLGFAAAEAGLAVAGAMSFGDTAAMHAATVVPAQAGCAVLMGGCAKRAEEGAHSRAWIVLAWVLPTILHAGYDLPLELMALASAAGGSSTLETTGVIALTVVVGLAAVLIVTGLGGQDASAATVEPNFSDHWPGFLHAILLSAATWWLLALACGLAAAGLIAVSWGLVAGLVPDLGLAAYALVPGSLAATCVLMTRRVTEGLDALDAEISARVDALRKRLFSVMTVTVSERIKRIALPWFRRRH